MNSCRENGLFYVWFINTCKKKKSPHPMMKNFMEMGGGGQKHLFIPLPQNILEGNGVVFENYH